MTRDAGQHAARFPLTVLVAIGMLLVGDVSPAAMLDTRDHHLDFFCRPPRAADWRHDPEDPDFADRDTVTRMKKTDRDKDWPIVGGLAAQAFVRGDAAAAWHLRDASTLRRAWSMTPAADRARAVFARPLPGSIDAGSSEDLRLEFVLRAGRLVWEAVNRHRYTVYQNAWKAR